SSYSFVSSDSRRPPASTRLPYTTLFRSRVASRQGWQPSRQLLQDVARSSLLRKKLLVFRRTRIQPLQLQPEAGGLIAVLMDIGQASTQQQAASVLLGEAAESVVITLRRDIVLGLISQHGKCKQCERWAATEAQRSGEVGLGLLTLAQLQGSHTHVLKHARAFTVQIVFGSLGEPLHGFGVTLLLEQKAAIVVQDPRIVATGERLAVVLVGKLVFHLGLEHQRQRRVCIGTGGVQLKRFT